MSHKQSSFQIKSFTAKCGPCTVYEDLDHVPPPTLLLESTTVTEDAATTTVVANMPAVRPDGVLYIMYVSTIGGAGTVATPSGWALLLNQEDFSNGTECAGRWFSRIGSSEPATYSAVSSQTETNIAAVIMRFSNASVGDSSTTAVDAGSGLCPTATAISTKAIVLRSYSGLDDDVNAPTGTTQLAADSTGEFHYQVVQEDFPSIPGSVGTIDFGVGSDGGMIAFTMIIE